LMLVLWILRESGEPQTVDQRGRIDGNQIVGQLIFGGVGAIVMVGGFVWALVTGRFVSAWRAVIGPLNWKERRSVRRQLAGKHPVEQSRLPVTIAIAHQNQRVTEALLPIYGGILLLNVPVAMGADDALSRYLSVVVSLSLIAVGAVLFTAYKRTDVFLDTHSVPGARSTHAGDGRSDPLS
jgi:hypothetical protein